MANDLAVNVEGLKELRKAIKETGDQALAKALAAANKAAAERVVAAGRPDAPRGPTGRLAGSVRALGSQSSGRAVVGGAKVPYAAAVHWGTGARSGKRGPHNIARNPFLLNAAERQTQQIAEEYEVEMDRLMEEIRKA